MSVITYDEYCKLPTFDFKRRRNYDSALLYYNKRFKGCSLRYVGKSNSLFKEGTIYKFAGRPDKVKFHGALDWGCNMLRLEEIKHDVNGLDIGFPDYMFELVDSKDIRRMERMNLIRSLQHQREVLYINYISTEILNIKPYDKRIKEFKSLLNSLSSYIKNYHNDY